MQVAQGLRERHGFVIGALVAVSLALLVVPGVTGLLRSPARAVAGSDFGAFHCGALVALHGADPYRLEPLKACEVERVFSPGNVSYETAGIDPAPFPPYFFAALAPLAALPYRTAAVLWHLGILLAAASTVALLAALTRLPWWALAPAVFLSVFQANFSVGQLPPFMVCALAAAGLLLENGVASAAALVASLCMLEPHVGLPVLISLFFWRPAARIPLGVAAAVAAGLGFAVPHAGRLWVEYVRDVLPVHAVAEAPVWIQLSATWLLRFFGVDERLAVQFGFWQYIFTCAAAVMLAGSLARRLRNPAALVFFPAAAAVFGGTFIHYGQVTIALPAAFLFAARTPNGASRRLIWIAIAFIAVSLAGRGFGHDVALVLCLFGIVAIGAGVTGVGPRLVAVASAGVATLALGVAIAHLPASGPSAPATVAQFATHGYDSDLASTVMGIEWRRTAANVTPSWRRLAEKLPVWLGLGCVLWAGVRFARAPSETARAQSPDFAGRSTRAKRRSTSRSMQGESSWLT